MLRDLKSKNDKLKLFSVFLDSRGFRALSGNGYE